MASSLPVLPSHTEWVLDTNRHPPVYSRPLVGSELWMHNSWLALDGVNELCTGVKFTSSLGIEEMRDCARQALDKFRFVCPIVSCVIESDKSPRWVYSPSVDREAWLNLAFVVEQRGSSLDSSEFVKDINIRKLPYIGADGTSTLFRVYLLVTSKEDDDNRREYALFIHSPHSMTDGGPSLHGLNLMCQFMSGSGVDVAVVHSAEWRNLPVDIIAATGGVPKEWETSGTELLQDAMRQAEQMLTSSHRLPPPSRPLDMSQRPIRHHIILSESETRAVFGRMKQLGVSISALFKAANGLAQFNLSPVPPAEDVYFPLHLCSVSPERYLKPSVNPKTYFASSLCMMPLRIPMTEPLRQGSEKATLIMTAKKVQEQFDRYLSDPCLPMTMPIIAQLPLPGTDQKANLNTNLHRVPWQMECDFQHFGMVESRISLRQGHISIDNVYLGARVTTTMSVRSWIMHRKLHFQIEGAAAWGDEFLKSMLEETIRIGLLILTDAKL
ncbi:hypothetical protein JVU11DRAFT_10203 [Chiua virens]|nr:hypothetical protein JVU11DRAFT_10203 [Chiua virens]